MSELPNFDTTPDVVFSDENKRTYARSSESLTNISKYVCEICRKDCSTAGGLASHKKFKHEVDIKEVLDNDMIKVLVPFDHNNTMLYSKDLNAWVSKTGFKIPAGFRVHKILNNEVAARKEGEKTSQNTIPVILIRDAEYLRDTKDKEGDKK